MHGNHVRAYFTRKLRRRVSSSTCNRKASSVIHHVHFIRLFDTCHIQSTEIPWYTSRVISILDPQQPTAKITSKKQHKDIHHPKTNRHVSTMQSSRNLNSLVNRHVSTCTIIGRHTPPLTRRRI
ncbi:hypothetical protein L1887_21582 [Cichorium endivia]|nr:hypothetical protein L1887_21582 [Cichorium endivia]